jgi:hypothetical protein
MLKSGCKLYKIFVFIIIFYGNASLFGQQINQIKADDHSKVNQFLELAETAISQGNQMAGATNYNKIAFIYWKYQYYREAIDYFLKSGVIYQKLEDLQNLKNVYTNIGVIYTDLQEIELSEEFFRKSVEIARTIGEKEEVASSLIDLAYILSAMSKFDESNQKLEEAYGLAEQLDNNQLRLSIYGLFAENYRNMNMLDKSSEFRDKYDRIQQFAQTQTMREKFEEEKVESMAEIQRQRLARRVKEDSLKLQQIQLAFTQDSLKFAEKLSKQRAAQIGLLKLDSANKALVIEQKEAKQREQEALIQQQKVIEQNQKLVIYGTAAVLLLALIAAISFLFRFRDKKRANKILAEQNREIEEKSHELSAALTKIQKQNKQITKSINYAKGIQGAMLPERKELNKYILIPLYSLNHETL